MLKARRDPANRYRLYRDADVTRLRFIRRGQVLGFTLKDIGQILRDVDRGHSPCPRTRKIIALRLDENEARLGALLRLHGRMKEAVRTWKRLPDALAKGDSICQLIEAVTKDQDLSLAFE